LGTIAGLRAFGGKPFPALGELRVFAFAGFLADAFVDLGTFAAERITLLMHFARACDCRLAD
jgi:hypothetical protein